CLPDPSRSQPFRLDTHRSRDNHPVTRPKQRKVVDAVEKRNDRRRAYAFCWRELEGSLELRRLRGHPEDVDLAVEAWRSRHVHLEVTESSTLHNEAAAVLLQRRRPHEQEYRGAAPGQRACEQAPNPAR